jgi:hypothetical protein
MEFEYLHPPSGTVYFAYQCEVSASLAEYHEAIERERMQSQREIGEQMKDNKI